MNHVRSFLLWLWRGILDTRWTWFVKRCLGRLVRISVVRVVREREIFPTVGVVTRDSHHSVIDYQSLCQE
jgi:hypothetical protein